MTTPLNSFDEINSLLPYLGAGALLRQKLDNDGSGNAIYIAWTPVWDAATSDNVWFIKKNVYDGSGNLTDSLLPDEGRKFGYSYDDRATYF